MMTLKQEAYKKIDSLPDDSIRLLIALIDKMQPETNGLNEKALKKERFLASAGEKLVDGKAIMQYREESKL